MLTHRATLVRGLPLVCAALLGACAAPGGAKPTTRTYYVAADEIPWDYVPGGVMGITGQPYQDSAFFRKGPPRPVSTRYLKALYREYTDSSFKTLKPRPPEWEHLGFLGPVLHAVVGDTIRVVFRNNARHPYSVHPHGVFYKKDSEGAPYEDGTSGADKADDGVPQGGTHVYVWPVPERAGPGPGDGSSIMWMYHSHTAEVRDVNTGLLGPIIVTASGKARADGTPADVDRELVTAFAQVHEENSWYAEQNIPKDFGPNLIANPGQLQNFYPYFVRFTINGYDHGGMPLRALTVKKGQRVRWYVFSSTNDFDGHAPHWHGNTLLVNQQRTDVVGIDPMQMLVGDMVPDNAGIWLFHCHVAIHLSAGMGVRYQVTE
jgi:FtsP/CotA-like multicopper oxidase with cupredoxin domain